MPSVQFTYTGAPESFEVPAGVTSVYITAQAGRGGYGNVNRNCFGIGAYINSQLTVTPGETLEIRVGGHGDHAIDTLPALGGWNGGGDGGYGGGGGGASDVRSGGSALTDRIIVAGGGGGTGGNGGLCGGDGGTPNGDAGDSAVPIAFGNGGGGGMQSAGGAGGTGRAGTDGAAGVLGLGGDGGGFSGDARGGGGGGAGYYGGGGGEAGVVGGGGGGGGGGSSWSAGTDIIYNVVFDEPYIIIEWIAVAVGGWVVGSVAW